MKHLTRTLGNERGVAIPLVAIAMLFLVGFTGLSVDIGRLGLVADETQNAADIAATAGAMQLFAPSPSDPLATPRQHAVNLMARNKIDNTSLSNSHLTAFEVGNYEDGTFTSNLPPLNAVRAEVQYTVNNIVFSGLGFPTTLVTKEAIAAFNPLGGGQPTIPLAIGECLLGDQCNQGGCNVALTQIPNPSDNSAWTGFFDVASANDILGYFPGGGRTPPTIRVGDFINLNNGSVTVPLLGAVATMLANGETQVLVPITSCGGSLNQAREVLGFATFEIVAVRLQGNNKGIDIRGLTAMQSGPTGGYDFASGTVTMVH